MAGDPAPSVVEEPDEANPRQARSFGNEVLQREFRVAVVSDLNGRYGSTDYDARVSAAVERVVAVAPDLVLSTGDMVAGQRSGLDYSAMWRAFHEAVSDPLSEAGIPFAATPGNHDGSGYPAFAHERSVYVSEWTARRPSLEYVDEAAYPLRYAFRAGGALFISLDATTTGPLPSEQRAWLEQVLQAHPSELTVVFGHVPLFPFAVGREVEALRDPELESLLREFDVDLFISGHHHAYYPGRRGPLRLVGTACLGGGPRPLLGQTEARGRSILLFEIRSNEIVALDAYEGQAFDERIHRATLPPFLGEGPERIDRDDLPSAELSGSAFERLTPQRIPALARSADASSLPLRTP
ncbi:MAG: metallophosphoesterase [Myxococcota bacterium]